jgi:2,3-bisphosphoglycerate-independent phosphoglycerate mutase
LIDFPYLPELIRQSDQKILMLVLGGIGGPPSPLFGRSELDAARIPNLDHLASQGASGVAIPVAPGISPGGAPGNLALLGYDPLKYVFGRGALEAIGTGLDLQPGDVAARGNLAIVDDSGTITDRRAGRISTEDAAPLLEALRKIKVPGVETEIGHTADHCFALRLRGPGLHAGVSNTDPMETDVPALEAKPEERAAAKTAKAINAFVASASEALAGKPANAVLLRGWASPPELPSMADAYQMKPAAIAAYPLYQGIAQAVGMTVYRAGTDFTSHLELLKQHWDEHDFFWVHYKESDVAAQDGDFHAKRKAIERLDEHFHDILTLKPDVLVVTGDHASPSDLGGHSWHPVPFVIRSAGTVGSGTDRFNEHDLRGGSLGQFESKHAMMLTLAHAGKLKRFGA